MPVGPVTVPGLLQDEVVELRRHRDLCSGRRRQKGLALPFVQLRSKAMVAGVFATSDVNRTMSPCVRSVSACRSDVGVWGCAWSATIVCRLDDGAGWIGDSHLYEINKANTGLVTALDKAHADVLLIEYNGSTIR